MKRTSASEEFCFLDRLQTFGWNARFLTKTMRWMGEHFWIGDSYLMRLGDLTMVCVFI